MTMRKLTLLFFSLGGLISCGATEERSAKVSDSVQSVAYLSSADGNLDIYIKNVKSQEVNQVTNNELDDLNPTWSFDGNHLAFLGRTLNSTFIELYNVASKKRKTLVDTAHSPTWIEFSPNENLLVFISTDDEKQSVKTVDLMSNIQTVYTPEKAELISPKFSRDGSRIAVIENDNITILTKQGTKSEIVPTQYRILDFDWGESDSSLYVTARYEKNINIYHLDISNNQLELIVESPFIDIEGRFSPPNNLLFLSSRLDGTTRQLYLLNLESKISEQLSPSGIEIMNPSWSSDGKAVTYTQYVEGRFTSVLFEINTHTHTPVSPTDSGFHLLPKVRPLPRE
ncbi:MAG: hypothetical protein KYX63_03075 [Alteromonas macleodii]|nr:hypothetical protein [Alteromonas macleodii]MEC7080733.1 hypothetical protein [Pseudomonadota bacterium]MEC8904971.1 hypothetical protein [Pseudomonadota bacterium]MEC9430782.1 hypothetical protein [Pseudomonadota bacterium]